MPSPDDHRSRRTITALSHSKPKPYRRYAYSDEPQRLSRMQIAVLTAGGIVVAGLMLTVAVIAQEHENATRGKAIISAEIAGAPSPVAPVPVSAPMAAGVPATDVPAMDVAQHAAQHVPAAQVPADPLPPVLDDSSLPIPDPLSPPMHMPVDQHLSLPAPKKASTPAARAGTGAATRPLKLSLPRPALRASPAPDPDVVLIASILTLTPLRPPDQGAAAQECTPGAVLENLCGALHGMRP
ncbi:hypothetical protein KY495_23060 [Massilia sp. PAMC28688]|uniref:hypothetical protein n=1 Tax=Massilia sp. PAMC28688 TaxID=2861283 RepID=UPI001C62F8D2|nr:hypothetical protein [Massilia sp. PAMC28688]QYF93501.1 hypothetical protein KY495_23060 [Massilia sp. PAMC28688]